jgi:hypothetical protein
MTTNNKHDVLKKLFTDESQVNSTELFELLSPFVKINKTDKSIIFLDKAHKQNLKNKIILFLLARKVLFVLGEIDSDRVQPKIIIDQTGIPRGSILPTLKVLREAKGGSLINSDKTGYYISTYQIARIKDKNILNNNEENK